MKRENYFSTIGLILNESDLDLIQILLVKYLFVWVSKQSIQQKTAFLKIKSFPQFLQLGTMTMKT